MTDTFGYFLKTFGNTLLKMAFLIALFFSFIFFYKIFLVYRFKEFTDKVIVYKRLWPYKRILKLDGTNIENIIEFASGNIHLSYSITAGQKSFPLDENIPLEWIKNFCMKHDITLYRQYEDYRHRKRLIIYEAKGKK